MGGDTNNFKALALTFANWVMNVVGPIDDFFVSAMNLVGIVQPQWQVITMLILISAVVMLAMRTLGWLVGWIALIFSSILLLHLILPMLGAQS